MDEFLKQVTQSGAPDVFSVPTILIVLATSMILSLVLAWTYRVTHRGLSYSVSYVHSMVIMAVTTAAIMLIIGSNIARAFSLVGALSIIRFRNAVKETRDVGFLFMAMAIGMAAGTQFFRVGILFTVFVCGMMLLLERFKIGAQPSRELILTVHLPEGADHRNVFKAAFERHLADHSLLSIETVRGGTMLELVYSIRMKPALPEEGFLAQLRTLNANNKVALLMGRDSADF